MTEQHECEWHFYEESADGAFCVKGFGCRLSRDKTESMLNEYETLKRATERLDAKEIKKWVTAQHVLDMLDLYTYTLEGKDAPLST